jgi:hypothetical protein
MVSRIIVVIKVRYASLAWFVVILWVKLAPSRFFSGYYGTAETP